jgi:DNA-binding NarL/FixJ family response regulator
MMRTKRNGHKNDASGHDGKVTAEVGVVLMDLSYQPLAMDEGAASILAAVAEQSPSADGRPFLARTLPPDILQAIRRSEWTTGGPFKMRFHAANRLYTGRAYLLEPQDSPPREPFLILHLEREAELGDAILRVSNEYHLTEREQEVLRGTAIGLTSKEMAERMDICPSTVKSFLRLIMIKMGAPNRAALVARLLAASRNSEGDSYTNGASATQV